MSSFSNNNGGVPGGLPSLNTQSSGGSLGGALGGALGGNNNNTGAAAVGTGGNGGMDELLPLVMQLTKPEQVRMTLRGQGIVISVRLTVISRTCAHLFSLFSGFRGCVM